MAVQEDKAMTTGEIIKQLRKERKMSQEDLAEYIGVQKSAVAKWETGRTKNIKKETLHALAILFGVQPSYLLDGKGEGCSDSLELFCLCVLHFVAQKNAAASVG